MFVFDVSYVYALQACCEMMIHTNANGDIKSFLEPCLENCVHLCSSPWLPPADEHMSSI